MRVIFMGTPALAAPHLEAVAAEHQVLAVVTQPDKLARVGREMQPKPSPVKLKALEMGLDVLQPERARDESFVQQIRDLAPEAIAVVAYGQILPQSLLDIPRENFAHGGSLNVHFSLLPRWRGAAPVQRSIQHGDAQTGVTVQWMAMKLDAGDVLLQETVDILPHETSGDLLERLTPIGSRMLAESLRLMQAGNTPRTPQDEANVTIAPSIERDEARLDWTKSAHELDCAVRAFSPWPTAWARWDGGDIKVLRAHPSEKSDLQPGQVLAEGEAIRVGCGAGSLVIESLQAAGKPKMKASDWARGARIEAGARFE
jgi:methionyl-tRNA formyltransferase